MRALVDACLAVLSAAVLAALAVSPASAVDAPIGGSWVDTCPAASMSGFTLTAQCRDAGGVLQTSTLDLLTCGQPATATNLNGRLVCESGPRRAPVPGSWAGSCANERLIGQSLTAQCLDTTGNKISASLNLSTCVQPASATNQNGQLVCASGASQPAPTSRFITLNTPPADLPAPSSRVVILQTNPPSNETTIAAAAPPGFAGTWSVTPDVGRSFVLVLTNAGSGITGDADVEGAHIRLSGTPVGAHLDAVWQINASNGPITGSLEFDLSPDRNQLRASLRVTGQFQDVRHWSGVRQGNVASAVPVPSGAAPGLMSTAGVVGFVQAMVNRSVSVRNKPSMSGSTVLRSLTQGTQIQVQCDKNWCALSTGDGFVSRGFLTLGAPVSAGGAVAPSVIVAAAPVRNDLAAGPAATSSQASIQPFGGPGCNTRPAAKSVDLNPNSTITLTFHNTSATVRHLLWINRDGGEVSYADIAAGHSTAQQTFQGHVWELTDDAGRCTLLVTTGNAGQTFEVQ